MFFANRHPDYLQEIERIGAASIARLHAKDAQVEQHRTQALSDLKRLAVEKAIVLERLKWSSERGGPRLDDPSFKRQVQDTAADLLFQSHLHISIDG
jgi:hypothetical protein